jgi:hypothetical protein
MKPPSILRLVLFAAATSAARAENLLDRLDESLSFSGFDDRVRARVSGTLDLEYYRFSGDAPGLIFSDDQHLANSRLSLFFDLQAGPQLYFFAQTRIDQGFDPSDSSTGIRLDEYALRYTPWEDGRFNLQAGRFATVFGSYVQRHQSWDNPFISAPLIYENMTGIYDSEAPDDAKAFTSGLVDAKYEYNPVIWGPSYATGLSVSGKAGQLDYAAEIKNAGLSSRPETWDAMDNGFEHPTVSARVAWHPDMAWTIGFSASEGPYLLDSARSTLPAGSDTGDFREMVLGQDVSYAWSHWQLWAEVYEARFEVPGIGDADTIGYYLEAKYKFTPNLFGALRWNQQFFSDVPVSQGAKEPWGSDTSRIDAAMTYRFTPGTQLKLQYSLQHESHQADDLSHLVAAQFTFRF